MSVQMRLAVLLTGLLMAWGMDTAAGESIEVWANPNIVGIPFPYFSDYICCSLALPSWEIWISIDQ